MPDEYEATVYRHMEISSHDAEPTALAYTPDHLMPTEPMPQAWLDAIDATTEPDFTHEETYRLALESIERWSRLPRLSPAMRLRAIRAVVTSALQSDGA